MRIIIAVRREWNENERPYQAIRKQWWTFKRHGADHDVYAKGTERESIPRHKEIKKNLAKSIIRRRGLK